MRVGSCERLIVYTGIGTCSTHARHYKIPCTIVYLVHEGWFRYWDPCISYCGSMCEGSLRYSDPCIATEKASSVTSVVLWAKCRLIRLL